MKGFGVAVTVDSNDIGDLTDASIPGIDTTDIDITTHDSTGGWREFLAGLKDGGTLELTGILDLDDTGQAYLAGNVGGAAVAVVLTFSDTSTASFSAYVKNFNNPGNPLDDKVEFSSSLKITGAVTYAAAA